MPFPLNPSEYITYFCCLKSHYEFIRHSVNRKCKNSSSSETIQINRINEELKCLNQLLDLTITSLQNDSDTVSIASEILISQFFQYIADHPYTLASLDTNNNQVTNNTQSVLHFGIYLETKCNCQPYPAYLKTLAFPSTNPDGSEQNPFTSLLLAKNIVSNGYYWFAINNNNMNLKFQTYVDNTNNNGWILLASGSASTNEFSYPETLNLTLQSDLILNRNVVIGNTDISSIRINGADPSPDSIDVSTQNAFILNNLRNFVSLSENGNGNIPNGTWSGTNSNKMNISFPTGSGPLDIIRYHASGNGLGLHWGTTDRPVPPPLGTLEKLIFFTTTKADLNLWISACP